MSLLSVAKEDAGGAGEDSGADAEQPERRFLTLPQPPGRGEGGTAQRQMFEPLELVWKGHEPRHSQALSGLLLHRTHAARESRTGSQSTRQVCVSEGPHRGGSVQQGGPGHTKQSCSLQFCRLEEV